MIDVLAGSVKSVWNGVIFQRESSPRIKCKNERRAKGSRLQLYIR
jgi:hypothetical protein